MSPLIVTAGSAYADIDVLACAIAYQELSQKLGNKCQAVVNGPLNNTISTTVKTWNYTFDTKPRYKNANYIVVDMSNPAYLPKFVNQDKIIELFDHHHGYEKYWQEKLGSRAVINHIGAAATLIWEQYQKHQVPISSTSANLLITAIISNTLNFNASVTDQRDKTAYLQLLKYTDLPNDWTEIYYKEIEKATLNNPIKVIQEDFHLLNNPFPITIGQIELWDSQELLNKYQTQIKQAFQKFKNSHWFLTSPSIKHGHNYLFTTSPKVRQLLEKTINAQFIGNIGQTPKLLMRKQILPLLMKA